MELTITLTEGDRRQKREDGSIEKLWLVSHEVMALGGNGQAKQFAPVRLQSCMNPEQVRIEPVFLDFSMEDNIRIHSLGAEGCYPADGVQLVFKPWTARKPDSHCSDCTKCRRCWA